jgi:hypothetical protein
MQRLDNLIFKFLTAAFFLFFITLNTFAVTFVVSNTNDSGAGSLRQAITNANAVAPGPNVVIDASGVTGVISLMSALPNLTRSVTIIGPERTNVENDLLIIERNAGAGTFRILTTNAGVSLTVLYLTFRNGRAPDTGGAIQAQGNLNVFFCRFVSNTANSAGGRGGAVLIAGGVTAVFHNCQFDSNSAAAWGGGVDIYQSTARFFNTSFLNNSSSNFGGGLSNSDATVEATNCTFIGNSATNQGGGIMHNDFASTAFVANSTFTHCTIVGNTAASLSGGINNAGSGSSIVRLNYCIIVGNTAPTHPNAGISTGPNISSTTGRNVFGTQDLSVIAGTTTGNTYGATAAAVYVTPAAFNGGFTRNISLAVGSPAIDHAVGSMLARDQRNLTRGGTRDAGAFENGAAALTGTATPMSITLSSTSICEGAAGTVTLTANNPFSTTAIYEWVIHNGTTFHSIGSGTSTTFSPSGLGLTAGTYTVYVIGAEQDFNTLNASAPLVIGTAVATATYTVNNCSGCVWTAGAGTSDWNTAGNWACGYVPTCSDDVIIPAGPTIMPIITGGTQNCRDITIQTGATSPAVTILGGDFNVCGNWINNATGAHLVHNNGTVNFTGAASQSVSGLNTFDNVTVNNGGFGVVLTAATGVKGLLNLQNGNLTSNGHLTMMSTATKTAMLVNNGAFVVVGNATVQRHVTPYGPRPVGLGYTYFSNPTSGGTISAAFSDDMALVFNPAYKFNCWLYPAPLSSAPFPNFYLYNESLVNTGTDAACSNESFDKFETGWQSAAAGTPFTPGAGFCVNIAGNTTFDVTGILNNGNINYAVTRTNAGATNSGWNLVGNPYPAPIDWDAVHAANAGTLNAQMMRRVATGTYSGTWAYYVAGVSGSGTNGATKDIAAAQGFFVRANANGTMQFNNSMRLTSYTNPNFFRKDFDLVRLKLSSGNFADETTVYFGNNSSEKFDAHADAIKSQFNSAPYPNFYSLTGEDARLAINGNGVLHREKVVDLAFFAPAAGKFEIKISHLEGFAGAKILLEDRKTGAIHDLNASAYVFEAEKGEDQSRFKLRFDNVQKQSDEVSLTPYPNPTSDKINCNFGVFTSGKVIVSDVLGAEILSGSFEGSEISLDVKHLPKGVYIIRAETETGSKAVKFVKE